jgi:hypothetical protein
MLCKSKCIDPSRPEGRLRMTSISLDLRGAKAPLYTTNLSCCRIRIAFCRGLGRARPFGFAQGKLSAVPIETRVARRFWEGHGFSRAE